MMTPRLSFLTGLLAGTIIGGGFIGFFAYEALAANTAQMEGISASTAHMERSFDMALETAIKMHPEKKTK
jgi:hypothetical protein